MWSTTSDEHNTSGVAFAACCDVQVVSAPWLHQSWISAKQGFADSDNHSSLVWERVIISNVENRPEVWSFRQQLRDALLEHAVRVCFSLHYPHQDFALVAEQVLAQHLDGEFLGPTFEERLVAGHVTFSNAAHVVQSITNYQVYTCT